MTSNMTSTMTSTMTSDIFTFGPEESFLNSDPDNSDFGPEECFLNSDPDNSDFTPEESFPNSDPDNSDFTPEDCFPNGIIPLDYESSIIPTNSWKEEQQTQIQMMISGLESNPPHSPKQTSVDIQMRDQLVKEVDENSKLTAQVDDLTTKNAELRKDRCKNMEELSLMVHQSDMLQKIVEKQLSIITELTDKTQRYEADLEVLRIENITLANYLMSVDRKR